MLNYLIIHYLYPAPYFPVLNPLPKLLTLNSDRSIPYSSSWLVIVISTTFHCQRAHFAIFVTHVVYLWDKLSLSKTITLLNFRTCV